MATVRHKASGRSSISSLANWTIAPARGNEDEVRVWGQNVQCSEGCLGHEGTQRSINGFLKIYLKGGVTERARDTERDGEAKRRK